MYAYILIAILVILLAKRMIKIVPDDSICIIEKNLKYYKTLQPGFHIIHPFVSARIVSVERRSGIPVSGEIQFSDSSKREITVNTTFLLRDPYTPFFTFERLDEEMSKKAFEEFLRLAFEYTKSDFEKNFNTIKQKCLDVLNAFGKQYGIEFTDIDVSL